MKSLIQSAKEDHESSHTGWCIAFIKRLINFYQENPKVLKLIHHLFFIEGQRPLPITELRKQIECFDDFIHSFQKHQEADIDTLNRFLMLLEICVAVCYNAIFFQKPASLDTIKDMFITTICECLASGQGGIS